MVSRRKQKHLRWRAHDNALAGHEMPEHDPPLTPHDEAVFLLHVAAEVEHALLLQYLYAAYSLKSPEEVPPEHQTQVKAWKKTLRGIAREEMGHLITVQNLLRLLGAPIILEREDYPFQSDLYPFHFRLEPVSKTSLAKYVVAEMPDISDRSGEIAKIKARATGATVVPVNRVGALYARIAHIFSPPDSNPERHISDSDLAPEDHLFQAHYEHWGNGKSVLVVPVRNREEALHAIKELSEQGEGLSDPDDANNAPSHYQRFLSIYREFPEPGEWEPAHAVPTNPNTSHLADSELDYGRISHPQARLWAQLSNLRYRLLLAYLSHFLQSQGPLLDSECNHTPRGYLNKWTFDEMRRLGQLAGKLATLPRRAGEDAQPERAGAPFELPYTLHLPDREPSRWRHHLDALAASTNLIRKILLDHPDAGSQFLQDLIEADNEVREIILAAASGRPIPHEPGRFKKVVRILEDAVRGFRVGEHHNFWRDCTRDEFISKSIFGNPLIAVKPDDTFDADNSNLIKALRGEPPFDVQDEEDPSRYPRMPAHHPPMSAVCVDFIHKWIQEGCHDDDPPGQIGIVGEHDAG